MIRILAIESSGPICSAALFEDGELVQLLESKEVNTHAENLASFCQTLVQENGKPDAISINTGPGSYTGLRIGVSLAKGLAYGYGIPVLGHSGLACMARTFLDENDTFDWVIPCIDARRMEVYQAVYSQHHEEIRPVEPLIVDENAWQDIVGTKAIIGDGAAKLSGVLASRSDIQIMDGIFLSASNQLKPSFRKFEAQDFLDLAYFEPVYLKEFQVLTAKKHENDR